MPVLPSDYYTSSGRQPLDTRSTYNFITSLISTTSSRIRLRSESSDIHSTPFSSPPLTTAIQPRELYFVLPLSYKGLDAGPSPGTVVGITLGSVLGFLLLVWLIQSIIRTPPGSGRYIEGDQSEIVVTRRSERSGKKHRSSKRSRRPPRSEMSSASSAGPPPPLPRQPSPPPPRRTERIIREEVRVRTESRPPVAMPMPPPMAEEVRETINININERPERRVDGDDIVEVIEETSDISPERSRTRRSRGGYRPVDPGAYAGGNFPQREVRGSSRRG